MKKFNEKINSRLSEELVKFENEYEKLVKKIKHKKDLQD